MKPRVLFLDHAGVLSGAELMLLDVASGYGGDCRVVLLEDGPFRERLQEAGVAVGVFPAPGAVSGIRREGGGLRDLRAAPGVLGLVRRVARLARGYDVLYANSQKALVVGALAGKLSRRPVVWHLHDMMSADHFSRKRRWLAVNLANRLVVRVVANSKATASAFVESGGRGDLSRVVYNGIDPGPFVSVVPEEVSALREDLGLNGVPVVGVFSRLAPWKGQHVLLKALAHLPGVHALLVGEALFGEHAYARSLRNLAASLGIADRTHFLGFREDVPRLMRLSDVVAHTSTSPEPFGRMIVEGMLAGRPVIATRTGGVTEILEDGVSGVLVAPEDSRELAATLSSVLADSRGSQALAKAGKATALERFSPRVMLDGVERQVREAVMG